MKAGNSLVMVLVLILLVSCLQLTGCNEGESIPLSPSSSMCEQPLDPAWHQVGGICGNKDPEAAVWTEGRMPVVVGSDGLIVECDSDRQWSTPAQLSGDNYYTLVSNSDDFVVAAGTYGTVGFSPEPGVWENQEMDMDGHWLSACADGKKIWLAGSDGVLASILPGEEWEFFQSPGERDLYSICAYGDSVFVGGNSGSFQVMVNGQWQDLENPGLADRRVKDILRLDDGRLLLSAGGLFIREESGWVLVPEMGQPYFDGEIQLKDGFLWVQESVLRRFDTSSNPWSERSIESISYYDAMAPGPDNQILLASNSGRMIWCDLLDDGTINMELDLAGDMGVRRLTCLLDGTLLFPGWWGFYEITGRGPRQIHGISDEVFDLASLNSFISGQSLDDFYLITGSRLLRCQGGIPTEDIPIPEEVEYVRELTIDRDGRAWVAGRGGLFCWEGGQWQSWLGRDAREIFVTQNGTVVLRHSSRDFSYLGNSGLVPLRFQGAIQGVAEPEPGHLVFLSEYFEETWWQMGTGASQTNWVHPRPECGGLNIEVSLDSTRGFLVATENYSMVLKRDENFQYDNWELVAGPCMHEIRSLQELEDGRLVALGDETGVILIYSPSPF